jgi:hypothetical protein
MSQDNAAAVFQEVIQPLLDANTIEKLMFNYESFSYEEYLSRLQQHTSSLTERQLAFIIGYTPEFFIQRAAMLIIDDHDVGDIWTVDKITASEDSRMKVRSLPSGLSMYMGGDLVLFKNKLPTVIIECKEYIDTIRLKELIGEAYLWSVDPPSPSIRNAPGVRFIVFAHVWELTDAWRTFILDHGLKGHIEEFFVVRPGKRKDKSLRPQHKELERFIAFLRRVLVR